MCKLPRYFVLAYLFCWPAAVLPQDKVVPLHVMDLPNVTMNLMGGACADGRAALMAVTNFPPEKAAQFKALESNWAMKDGSRQDFAGCWVELSKEETGSVDAYLVIFSDGDYFVIPKDKFDIAKGAKGA